MKNMFLLVLCVVMRLATIAPSQCTIAMGSGMSSDVSTLAVLPNGDLIAGGTFTTAGGVTVNRIARWNGTSWSALGTGMDSTVYALAVLPNGDLIAGGSFITASGELVLRIARWNGTSWSAMGTGMNNQVTALAVLPNGDVIAGGSYFRMARWDGTSWSVLGTGMDGISALAVLPNGDLIAGGWFTTAGGVTANRIARWNGTSWSAMGTGMNNEVAALAVLPSGDVIAGGSFTTAGGVSANRIARWNGTSWSALGSGMNIDVRSLAVRPNGDLIAGGYFTTAGGVTANRIARWDGTSWSALGQGMNEPVSALAALPNGNIAAGGNFTQFGVAATPYVAIISPEGQVAITSQPADVSLLPGGLATFSVQATGADLTYRWRRNGVDLFDDDRHRGTATPAFTLSSVSNADQGLYTCMISNSCGSRETRAAELSCKPLIVQQPPVQVVLPASGATISVQVPSNVANRYIWRKKGQNLFNIPGLFRGVTTPTLQLLSNDPSLIGSYDVQITNDCGRTTSNVVFVVEDTSGGGCVGDHNQDGGVDGGDVEAFFLDWQNGLFEADVNQDGGVDGSDVQTFFVAWQSGC